MQKHLFFVFLLLLSGLANLMAGDNPPASLSGTYLVGNSQPVYKKLTHVAAALNNAANTVTGNIIFELDSDYIGTTGETFPITFNRFNSSGNWTVTIRPKAGVSMRTTAGMVSNNESIIKLNGADRIILDGRAGGSGGIAWLIRNTYTNLPGPTIILQNDAQHNTLTYLQVEGQNPYEQSGVICLAGTTGTKGNDNNTISYCRIRDRSDVTGRPVTGIFINGEITDTAVFNSGTVITHNDIFNMYDPGGVSNRIYIFKGATATSITHNNFYNTYTIENTEKQSVVTAVRIRESKASGMNISDNFIGGSAPACGGEPFTVTSTGDGYLSVSGIAFDYAAAIGTGNTVSNNTISNFDIGLEQSPSTSFAVFEGIEVRGSAVNITGNTIGSNDEPDAVKITLGGYPCSVQGISMSSAVGGSISGNKVGGITIGGSSTTTITGTLSCIFLSVSSSTANYVVENNTIGSTTVSDNIRIVSTILPFHCYGILSNLPSTATGTYNNNKIGGFDHRYAGTTSYSYIAGIRLTSHASAVISNNLISGISSASLMTGASYTIEGIFCSSLTAVKINDNIIRGLRLTNTGSVSSSSPSTVMGIELVGGAGTTTAEVYNNKLYDFASANKIVGSSTMLFAISPRVSSANVYNNMISLTNGDNTNNCEIRTFYTANSNIDLRLIHNTIHIGGNNGDPGNTAPSSIIARSNSGLSFVYYLRNNIFVNARTGGNGSHYIFFNVTSPFTTWPSTTSNYNVLVSANNKFGRWGDSELDPVQWKTTTRMDANSSFYAVSEVAPADLFTSLPADLSIRANTRQYVAGKGVDGTGITIDYDGKTRHAIGPSAGAYEYPSAVLYGLAVSAGILSPVFNREAISYADTVNKTINSITVTPTAIDAGATIMVNGSAVASGGTSGPISLSAGSNTITIVVTAEGGITTKTYTVIVFRSFGAPVITSYNGGAAVNLQIPENTMEAATVTTDDPAAVFSVGEEGDGSLFSVNSTSGVLSFIIAPDFEHPADGNADNIYIVSVKASSGDYFVIQRFKLKVTDVNDHAPVITSHNGDAAVSLRLPENTMAVSTVTATDSDRNAVITYSLVNEEDAAKFSMNPSTGELVFTPAPDFDRPGDTNGDNVYIVTVKASDGDSSATQRFKIKIMEVNDNTPLITSHNGDAAVNLQLPENTIPVATVTATDGDAGAVITYSLVDEGDAGKFLVNASTGELKFITAPDFEHPGDGNGDNIYQVAVKASDGTLSAIQSFTIKITDTNDNLPVLTMTMRIPENTVEVTNLAATDDDAGSTVTLSIGDGEDDALFRINPVTGDVEFITAADFENPADANGDNTYLLSVVMSDGSFSIVLRLKVKITDVDETAGRSANRETHLQQAIAPETKTGKGITAYPNPVTNKRFTLRMDSVATGRYTMEVYTATGQLAYKQSLNHTGKSAGYPIQLPANFTRGIYILKLTGISTRYTGKLIIE